MRRGSDHDPIKDVIEKEEEGDEEDKEEDLQSGP